MADRNSIVIVYNTPGEVETAVKRLQEAGFDMAKLSIIGREHHTGNHVISYHEPGERMKYWGSMGAFWGKLWGVIAGAAFFEVPGIGPIIVAGPVAGWMIAASEQGAELDGLNVFGAGLYSIGIGRHSILRYESALRADKFLLIGFGGKDEIARAREILGATRSQEMNIQLEGAPPIIAP